ncbi:MAG TPA: SAM-dependent methyltransferase [Bryobacteraceae bacterium]|jgi:tRNA-Thr(GGU) m(6)t(6)A37 methyltransferase TsaA|nr:SAM-dependent methyltransferase [Bryobacteraceae bacterium]
MLQPIEFRPVGIVRSPVVEPADNIWGSVKCRIELDPSRFTPDSLLGLADFSHVEIIFFFHRVPESEIETRTRHPRNRLDFPRVGIFAQRGRNRPNRLGVTICRLESVKDMAVEVVGLDAIDGTPVLDIKPYVQEFAARGEVRQPKWVDELMRGYWGSTYFG